MKRLLVVLPAVWMTAGMAWSNPAPTIEPHQQPVQPDAAPSVDETRHGLLDLAMGAAAKLPSDPHLKNKARYQYEIATCALDVNHPDWAEHYAEQVLYWEKGKAFADIALYYAEHGNKEAANTSLTRAEDWFQKNEPVFMANEREQSWRLDRVRTAIVQAGIALDREQGHEKYTSNLGVDAMSGVVLQKARTISEEDPSSAFGALTELAKTGEFEVVKNVVTGLVELYGQHYEDQDLRASIKEQVEEYCANTPMAFRVDMLTRLGEADLEHGNTAEALACANKAETITDALQSPPRFQIPLDAEIASLRYRAGEQEKALQDLDGCIKLFDEKNRQIINIDQADILCSIAEAYWKIGDLKKSLALYSRAIDAGQLNPNSRPRVEDLCGICCSIVRSGIAPSPELLRKLEDMNNGLGNPW